jgi:hypothetical protein
VEDKLMNDNDRLAAFKADIEAVVRKHKATYRVEYDPYSDDDTPTYVIVLDGNDTVISLTDLMPRKYL